MDHTNAVLTFATGGCSITDVERNEGRRATSMQKKNLVDVGVLHYVLH